MYETSKVRTTKVSLADSFRFDQQMESLERLQRERPDQFDTMPAFKKVELGYYKIARTAAQELGRDVSGKDCL